MFTRCADLAQSRAQRMSAYKPVFGDDIGSSHNTRTYREACLAPRPGVHQQYAK
jgi:hypothetical protein